jgi:hypothetical protein
MAVNKSELVERILALSKLTIMVRDGEVWNIFEGRVNSGISWWQKNMTDEKRPVHVPVFRWKREG